MEQTSHIFLERHNIMYLVGIDIGKLEHTFCIMNRATGELLVEPTKFKNTLEGFQLLLNSIPSTSKDNLLIGMEDTGHYHFALLRYLLERHFTVALINPVTTNLTRKIHGGITKTDNLDTITICDVLCSNQKYKAYRISKFNSFDMYEQKQLTRHHHDLKETRTQLLNKLQKSIDIVFPEYNSLFKGKYSKAYNRILKTFGSADAIAHADIRNLRKCFENGRGSRIKLTAEQLKEAAINSIGIPFEVEVINIKNLLAQVELLNQQLHDIDKKIEEFSSTIHSPITSIPGISHFSGTSILAELGDINNFTSAAQIIKFAGVAPLTYESSQFTAKHTAITKKGSKYFRKTLYQIILPVIQHNPVFHDYYQLKISQGKSHRCAQGHCVRKLLRVIFHLLKTNQSFDSTLLV